MSDFRFLAAGILTLSLALPAVGQTRIQPPTLRPSEKPTVSSYLLLGPNSTIFQRDLIYFSQRRNERRINSVNRDLRTETRRLDNSLEEIQRSPANVLPTRPLTASDTGHNTTFFNTFNYFPQRRGR